MFQNRCPFLYNSSAFLLSFLCIVWISFYPGTSSLEPFSIFYDLIASYYTKGKWQWRKVIYFVWNHIILIIKYFFTSAFFSPFDLKSSLNRKMSSLRAKVCFCDWQMFQFFHMLLGYNFPRTGNECNKNMNWVATKLTYFWHKNEKKFLNFIFVFEPLRFRHSCHAISKFASQIS